MPDFTVNGLYEGPKGEVWATGSASPIHIETGKQMPFPTDFVHRVSFDEEGKCMYFKFFNGPSTMYQDSLVSINEAIVPPMIPTPPQPAADKNFGKEPRGVLGQHGSVGFWRVQRSQGSCAQGDR